MAWDDIARGTTTYTSVFDFKILLVTYVFKLGLLNRDKGTKKFV